MDPRVVSRLRQHVPQMNPDIIKGVSVIQMAGVVDYVEHVWRCAARSFPPGFEYLGSETCTPEEEYREIADSPKHGTRVKRAGRGKIELARSDVFLMKYRFSWEGIEIPPRYLFLPFVGQAGLMHLRGPRYCVSPVLADPAFSPAKNNGVFTHFTRDKITINRSSATYVCNRKAVSTYVVWSAIHTLANDQSKRRGVTSCLPHYLFSKYGLQETFRRFANCDVVVGYSEIDEISYPTDDWVICESAGISPSMHKKKHYIPSKVRLAIPRTAYYNTDGKPNVLIDGLVAGFFYVTDHFPDRIRPEFCSSDRFWRLLLGYVIIEGEENGGKIQQQIDAHMASLDEYVDDLVRETFQGVGIDPTDIYEFFVFIMQYIHEFLLGVDPASMYGKKLTVLRYVMLDIVIAIFRFTYDIRSSGKKGLNSQNIRQALGRRLNRDLIFNLASRHGEVQIISSSSDCALTKLTSTSVLQERATVARKRRGKGVLSDPSKLAHISLAECGSLMNLPKSEPTGRTRINPYIRTRPDGTIERDPERQEYFDSIQEIIQR